MEQQLIGALLTGIGIGAGIAAKAGWDRMRNGKNVNGATLFEVYRTIKKSDADGRLLIYRDPSHERRVEELLGSIRDLLEQQLRGRP